MATAVAMAANRFLFIPPQASIIMRRVSRRGARILQLPGRLFMRKPVSMSLVLCVLLALPVMAQEPTPRAVLEKAIAAHGGEKALTRHKASHSRSKGKIHIGAALDFTAEEDVQFPDKFRSALHVEANNQNVTIIQVFDGKKGWVSTMGKTTDLDDKANAEIQELLHAMRVANMVGVLSDKTFTLAPLGELKVKDKDAVGVRVSHPGKRDVNLYFDRASGLLVKLEGRGLNPLTNQEANQEKFFSDYHEVDGRKSPRKVEVHNDGQLFVEVEILEIQLLDRHDDSTFKRP
jgi:hypothetical protein